MVANFPSLLVNDTELFELIMLDAEWLMSRGTLRYIRYLEVWFAVHV